VALTHSAQRMKDVPSDQVETAARAVVAVGRWVGGSAKANILPAFLPDPLDECFDPIRKWVAMLSIGIKVELEGVLTRTATVESVKEWVGEGIGDVIRVFVDIFQASRDHVSAVAPQKPFDFLMQGVAVMEWVASAACMVTREGDDQYSVEFFKRMAKGLRDHLEKPLPSAEDCEPWQPHEVEWAKDATEQFLSSPFICGEGGYASKVAGALESYSKPIVDPLITFLKTVFGENKLGDIDLGRAGDVSAISVELSAFSPALSWAEEAGDKALSTQLTYLYNAASLLVHVMKMKRFADVTFAPGAAMKDAKVTEETLKMVCDGRASYNAFDTCVSLAGGSDLFADNGDPYHSKAFHSIVDFEPFNRSIRACFVAVQGAFGGSWSSNLAALRGAIEEGCPNWQWAKDTLLDHVDLCDALCKNEKYSSLSPLAAEIKRQVKLIKRADHYPCLPPLVDPKGLKDSVIAGDLGIETVSFTFAIYKLLKSWPGSVLSKPEAEKQVIALKKSLEPSKVQLSDQINLELNRWEDGTRLETPFQPRAPAPPAAAAPAAEPPAVEPPLPPPEAPPPPPASLPGSSPGASQPVVGSKLSLKERM
ncbi:unnamed protein product, partial [Prorocentrum cordatum]